MRATAQQREWRTSLGSYMEDRRIDLQLLWNDVAAASGLTTETLRNIRNGTGGIRPLNKRAIENALKWQPGSIDRILAGEQPIPLSRRPAPANGDHYGYPRIVDAGSPAPWLQAELQRARVDVRDLSDHIAALRDIGQRFGYSIGDLLIEAGIAAPPELALRTPDRGPSDAFEAEIERIENDPRLTAGEKLDLVENAQKLREAATRLAQKKNS
jgi:hypothetical protein